MVTLTYLSFNINGILKTIDLNLNLNRFLKQLDIVQHNTNHSGTFSVTPLLMWLIAWKVQKKITFQRLILFSTHTNICLFSVYYCPKPGQALSKWTFKVKGDWRETNGKRIKDGCFWSWIFKMSVCPDPIQTHFSPPDTHPSLAHFIQYFQQDKKKKYCAFPFLTLNVFWLYLPLPQVLPHSLSLPSHPTLSSLSKNKQNPMQHHNSPKLRK